MTKEEIYEEAALILLDNFRADADYMPEYSGRGMYGKSTPAITTEAAGPYVGLAIALAVEELGGSINEAEKFIPRRSDSMGRDSAVYY